MMRIMPCVPESACAGLFAIARDVMAGQESTCLWVTLTAVFEEKGHQLTDSIVSRKVIDIPALAPAGDQSGMAQYVQVKREGWSSQVHVRSDFTGTRTARPFLH